jgi:YidC/Oxa1 family membrane protein insertase
MKDMNQRLFVAIALWLGLVVLGNLFFPQYFGFLKPQRPQAQAPANQPPAPAQAQAPAPSQGAAPAASPAQPPASSGPRAPAQKVTLTTARVKAVATSDGAGLSSIQLLGDKFTKHKQGSEPEAQVDLVQPPRAGEPAPYSTIVKDAAGNVLVPVDAAYDVVAHDERSVTFRTKAAGATVTKTLRLDPATYRVGLDVEVSGVTGGTVSVVSATHAKEPQGGFFTPHSAPPARSICGAGGKVERENVGAKKPVWSSAGASFAGIDEQYFLTAVVAPEGVNASCEIQAQTTGEKEGWVSATLTVPLAPKLSFSGFAGPKDKDELTAVAKALGDTVDLGFWKIIADVLLGIMKLFHKLVPPHNWGIAIILLTIFVKLLTFPLQHKSMKSMQEMQKLQPQLEEMKKKYAGDQQRQNLEQMKLFKEHGVNPMGSCLPMVIQMPIWFALYTTLQVSVELYNAPFIHGWLDDLTARDPFYILPVLMGATMILTQVLTPSPMSNPSQKTMGYVMSGFFSLLMLTLPSGLTLYIFTNNVLSIVQQMYLRRALKLHPAPARSATVKVS